MNYRRFGKTVVVRMDKGEEILENLKVVCEREKITLANVNALGAINDFEVGLFDVDKKQYYSKEYTGNFEIVSLTGNITTKDGETYMHIHLSAGDKENKVYGGHLNKAIVSATCEMFIQVIEGTVEREFDEKIGLNLFKFTE